MNRVSTRESSMLLSLLIYIVIGAVTGFLAGLIGIGGGVVGVPALVYAFTATGISQNIIMHLAEGTSIAAIMFNMVTAVFAHHKNKLILWYMVKQLAPGVIVGCIVGACVATLLSTHILKMVFGIFMLLVAIQLLLAQKPHESERPPPGLFIQRISGLAIGLMSGLLGIGGGVVAIPLLLRFGLPMRNAAATSITCALIASIIGTITFTLAGWHVAGTPAGTTGFVYWPAAIAIGVIGVSIVPLGAKLAKRLSNTTLKRIFAVVLLIIGVEMLVR
jgi:uncharacterized membrane protein YfcA